MIDRWRPICGIEFDLRDMLFSILQAPLCRAVRVDWGFLRPATLNIIDTVEQQTNRHGNVFSPAAEAAAAALTLTERVGSFSLFSIQTLTAVAAQQQGGLYCCINVHI